MLAGSNFSSRVPSFIKKMLDNQISVVEIARDDWKDCPKLITEALLETSSVKRLQFNFLKAKDICDILDCVSLQKSRSIQELIFFGSNPRKIKRDDDDPFLFSSKALDLVTNIPHLLSIEFEYCKFESHNPLFRALINNHPNKKQCVSLGLYECVSSSMSYDPYLLLVGTNILAHPV